MLRKVAEAYGFTELGSAARGDDRQDSDVDLPVQPPSGANRCDPVRVEEALEGIIGRDVNLVSYRGLDPRVDRDILRDRVLL